MKFWTCHPGYLSILVLMITAVKGEVDTKVKEAMEKNQVVPDVISKAPDNLLEVQFGAAKVNLGTVMKPDMVAKAPKLFWNGDQKSFYTVCMIDPDAPSRTNPKAREWKHWLVGNIPGNDVEKGDGLCPYAGPTPPPGTGLHRYVLLVYKQPGKLQFEEEDTKTCGGDRGKFSVSKFANKHNLGDPIAGNFFLSQN